MNGFDNFIAKATEGSNLKRKREDGDIPRPFLRGGDGARNGAATGANAIGVKKIKSETP
jgi:hypothetical protein